VARRFGIDPAQLPQLTQWMSGAGIRWGLHAAQRAQLDLAACGDQNSAWFGLQRMLLGYASGVLDGVPGQAGWQGIEPYAEVGGLDAELAGSLAHLLQTLGDWWQRMQSAATPETWRDHGQWLLAAMFKAADEVDTQALSALSDGLGHWLRACEQAGFAQTVGLAALRHGWMDALQVPSLEQRFRAGGVTFCTLMPMRAIPFEVVCLLGMNDGDYPRRTHRSDFDLMGQRGMFRPGDRSRQHDDRQLMLEALLSARRVLYVSWTGHSVRNNSEQPPSVLVSQLRDYIASAWGDAAVNARTASHPLQPFSRRYFEEETSLLTYAREWRGAHDAKADASTQSASLNLAAPDTSAPLDLDRLVQFFRNPVKAFFKERLGVGFWSPEEEPGDTEAFGFDGLENYQLIQSQTRHWPAPQQCGGLDAVISTRLDALQRAGELPMQGLGQIKKAELQGTLTAMAQAWAGVGQAFPMAAERVAVSHSHQGAHATVMLRDWIDAVLQNEAGERSWVLLEPSKITAMQKGQAVPRPDKLLRPWLQALLAAAAGQALHGRVVGQDGELHITPMPTEQALPVLDSLLDVWLIGQQEPLPLPLKTALAMAEAARKKAQKAAQSEEGSAKDNPAETAYEGGGDAMSEQLAEVREMCLARVFPDYEALCAARTADGQDADALARLVYGPLLEWAAACVTAHPYAAAEAF
jgi:exodeoxyribonuclease V gamma subunit